MGDSPRREDFISYLSGLTSVLPPPPYLREEQYWVRLATGSGTIPEKPITRMEQLLDYYLTHGSGGDITVEPFSTDENGDFTAPAGKAYSPLHIAVPVPATQEQLDTIAEGIGVATPSTPASIESAVDGLIDDANAATGESDTNLTDAVGSLIAAVPEGGPVYINDYGTVYLKDMDLSGISKLDVDSVATRTAMYAKCIHMRSMLCAAESVGAASLAGTSNMVNGCTALETLAMPKAAYYGHYFARDCTSLKTVQLGSIGHPVTSMSERVFYNDTQNNLTITVYVDAATTADIVADVKNNAPWGATNATIVYRNSTTGEIIEEPLGYAWVPSSDVSNPTPEYCAQHGLEVGSNLAGRRGWIYAPNSLPVAKAAYYPNGAYYSLVVATTKLYQYGSIYLTTYDPAYQGGTYYNAYASLDISTDNLKYARGVCQVLSTDLKPGIPVYETYVLALAAMDDGNWTP